MVRRVAILLLALLAFATTAPWHRTEGAVIGWSDFVAVAQFAPARFVRALCYRAKAASARQAPGCSSALR